MKVMKFYFSCLFLGGIVLSAASLANDLEQSNSEVSRSESSNTINNYQSLISQVEISAGPYSKELITPLLSLGILQNENNLYSNADDSFKRALQIHRINNGLHDLKQVPVLELIISNSISQQNWKATHNNYQLYHWLHRRNYEKTNPKMLAVVDKLIAWHLLGTNLETGLHPGEHFMQLLELNGLALQIVENYPIQDDLELAKRLYKLALIHYYIAIAVQRGAPTGIYLAQKFSPIMKGDSYKTNSEKIARKRFRISRKLVSRIVALYENNTSVLPGSTAIALVYLADWDLLFNRHTSANRGYHLAYGKLLDSGFSREIINSFFLQPKILPKSEFSPDLLVQYASNSLHTDNVDSNASSTTADGAAMDFIGWSTALPGVKYPTAEINTIVSPSTERYSLVSFDVLKDGLAENIRISRDNPENSLPRHATYNAIWSAQFRPRLLDGIAVEASDMSTRFYMPSIETRK